MSTRAVRESRTVSGTKSLFSPANFDKLLEGLMCNRVTINQLVKRFVKEASVDDEDLSDLRRYARVTLVTKTPVHRAIRYLQDTADPKAAEGRLLLRAAERALRESGEVNHQDYADRGVGAQLGKPK